MGHLWITMSRIIAINTKLKWSSRRDHTPHTSGLKSICYYLELGGDFLKGQAIPLFAYYEVSCTFLWSIWCGLQLETGYHVRKNCHTGSDHLFWSPNYLWLLEVSGEKLYTTSPFWQCKTLWFIWNKNLICDWLEWMMGSVLWAKVRFID